MHDKLEMIEKRYSELEQLLSDPKALDQRDEWLKMSREMSSITPVVTLFRRLKEAEQEAAEAEELLHESEEAEMSDYLQAEVKALNEEIGQLDLQIKEQLLPKDPYDDKSVLIEIRAGTGGEEAALFAADLLKMYSRYAERYKYKVDLVDAHPTDIGGFKEVILGIEGKGAYSRLKYESGVHRVQRIPTTESGGRIHTSAATVAVLPEVEEVEVEINQQDLRIDTFCATGPGGQSVNTTQPPGDPGRTAPPPPAPLAGGLGPGEERNPAGGAGGRGPGGDHRAPALPGPHRAPAGLGGGRPGGGARRGRWVAGGDGRASGIDSPLRPRRPRRPLFRGLLHRPGPPPGPGAGHPGGGGESHPYRDPPRPGADGGPGGGGVRRGSRG